MAKEASLDDCIKLLEGDNDERRLVGLLLATKFVKGDDIDAVRKLFTSIGFQFINRLIKSGSGQVERGKHMQRSYLHLALSILAGFCRLPDLASSDEAITKVPVLVTTLASEQNDLAAGDCYECLLAIGMSSERGMQSLFQTEVLPVISHHLHDSAPDAPWIPAALKLFHSLLVRVAATNVIEEYAKELTYAIPPVAQQFALQQDSIKFEALSILYSLLVSDISAPIKAALGQPVSESSWQADVRTGVGQILHSRVAVEQKYLVLELAESTVELVGDLWLSGLMEFPGKQGTAPPNRFFLLVLETLRVETTVLLNEVGRIAFDTGENAEAKTSKTTEAAAGKQRRLMKCFALLEHVISTVAAQEDGSKQLSESTLQATIVALDEVVGVVLELLEDAQAHHQSQGEVLLASVRIISRYLAEAPSAHLKRCQKILHFLLSVSTPRDERPFLAVQFMLPYLTQITQDLDGCKAFLITGGHSQVVNFCAWATLRTSETKGSLVDVCDILLNLLTKKYDLTVNITDFVPVLPALATWVGHETSKMESAIAASVCVSVLTWTNEDNLKKNPEVGPNCLHQVFQLIILMVEQYLKGERGEDLSDEEDLLEIILSGSVACINHYPSFKVELRAWVASFMNARGLSRIQDLSSSHTLLQLLVLVLKH